MSMESNKSKAAKILKYDRITMGRIVQFVTGHTFMKRHENVIEAARGVGTDPTCSICGDGEETPIHLIHDCGPLHFASIQTFGIQEGYNNRTDFTLKWKVHELVRFLNLPEVSQFFKLTEDGIDPPEGDPQREEEDFLLLTDPPPGGGQEEQED